MGRKIYYSYIERREGSTLSVTPTLLSQLVPLLCQFSRVDDNGTSPEANFLRVAARFGVGPSNRICFRGKGGSQGRSRSQGKVGGHVRRRIGVIWRGRLEAERSAE